MNERPAQNGVLIYDSECNLCLATKSWIEKRDQEGNVGFLSAYDPSLQSRFPQIQGLDLLGEITWIDRKGHVQRGADAVATALQQLPAWSWAGRLLLFPGASILRHVAYRWVARHRYRIFGRTCDSGGCRLHSAPQLERRNQIWPTCFSFAVLIMVASPILQNLRPYVQRKDDFPLSYYPMFSTERLNLHEQPFVGALDHDGTIQPVHYSLLGNGGLNQNRRQLGNLIKKKNKDDLRDFLNAVADRLSATSKTRYQNCVSVAAINGTYDLNAYFTKQSQQPTEVDVVMKVEIPNRSEGLDTAMHLSN